MEKIMGLFKNTKSVEKVLEAELQTIYTKSSWDEEVQNWLQNEIETQQEEVDDNEMYSEELNIFYYSYDNGNTYDIYYSYDNGNTYDINPPWCVNSNVNTKNIRKY